jgi:hypothetical protein
MPMRSCDATRCRDAQCLVLRLTLGIRVTRIFRVGSFGVLLVRVCNIINRYSLNFSKTRQIGYPENRVRVQVFPYLPELEQHL